MRTKMCLAGVAVLLVAFCLAAGEQKQTPKPGQAPVSKAAQAKDKTQDQGGTKSQAPKPGADAAQKPKSNDNQDNQTADQQELSPDLKQIVENAAKFVKAYGEGDAQAIAAQFTEDGEYVDDDGNVFQGRKAIEETLSEFFKQNKGSTIELNIDSVRQVGPGVMVEDGTSTAQCPSKAPQRSRYTAVHVKVNGEWLTASARDHAIRGERVHAERVKQLEWLIGDWIDEDNDSIVVFSCQPADDGNFLIREFMVTVAGERVMSGTQRIGWDPVAGKLRAWTFDSEGGFYEGTWHQDGDTWVLTSHGTTPDGESASATNLFTPVNAHTMTWQAVDREIDGARAEDSEVFTLVRRAPELEQSEKQQDSKQQDSKQQDSSKSGAK